MFLYRAPEILNYYFWNRDPRNWDTFSSELKDVLSNIVHLSTLKTPLPQGRCQSANYLLPPDCPPYDIEVAFPLAERFW